MAATRDHGLAWRRANRSDLSVLHQWYLAEDADPFVLDLCGHSPDLNAARFRRQMTEDADLSIAVSGSAPCGFLWFSFIQPRIRVADVDWRFVHQCPRAGRPSAADFAAVFRARCSALRLVKVHLRCLPEQTGRLRLARALGFLVEGRLRQQIHHDGTLKDLVCLGWRRP